MSAQCIGATIPRAPSPLVFVTPRALADNFNVKIDATRKHPVPSSEETAPSGEDRMYPACASAISSGGRPCLD